jgi:parvulin-like peptidyl-prolyl isomerase
LLKAAQNIWVVKMENMRKHSLGALVLLCFMVGAGPAGALAQESAASQADPVFATVAGTVITQSEYGSALQTAARSKFYHGKPPEGEVAALQREVANKMVARVLLLREAKRLGMRPDAAAIGQAVQGYEQRYAGNERWQKERAQVLPRLTERLEQDNLLAQLENDVRAKVVADPAAARAYYARHPEKFTEPERLRVSLILLKVDPAAAPQILAGADAEARAIAKRLREGADMAELARLHSADRSAAQGGDMGYLHAGMLPNGAEEVLKAMRIGQISDPVRVLEGIAIFRLTERKEARLLPFDTVAARAGELQLSEGKDAAWAAFVAELRRQTPAQIDESLFFPLAGPVPEQGRVK